MSSWIVSRSHVAALVDAAVVKNLVTADEASKTGRMLWNENVAGVLARYGGSVDELPGYGALYAEIGGYKDHAPEDVLTPAVVLQSARCLEYQSCDSGDVWDASPSRRLLDRIIAAYEYAGFEDSPEFKAAPWGIEEI